MSRALHELHPSIKSAASRLRAAVMKCAMINWDDGARLREYEGRRQRAPITPASGLLKAAAEKPERVKHR
ncbi:hypothetical protein NDU88_005483 [Pleurodeles waltl]|uniref:Uncharacterized protein n=1 Tax=Pleurodeles waltl TaxID=8319 RepID=A0AAV7TCU0_PLEWA|nr:hypothetical protein NDU88_005483 [Pleurodeles waltl]